MAWNAWILVKAGGALVIAGLNSTPLSFCWPSHPVNPSRSQAAEQDEGILWW